MEKETTLGDRLRTGALRVMNVQEGGLLLFLIIMAVGVYFGNSVFLSERNLMNILRQVSMWTIAGVGMTVLIITGEVDLSIGSLQGLVTVIVIDIMNKSHSLWVGILAGLGVGLIVGLVNSFIVLKLRVNSLIATLGMMMVLRGSAFLYNWAAIQNKWKLPEFRALGNGFLWRIPLPVVYMIVILVIFYLVLSRTSFGRYIYATGGNPNAVALSGVRVQRLKMWAFVLCSVLASVAGIILASRMNSGQANAGIGFELTVIGGVVLGGTSLAGGEGNLLGSFLGILIMGVVYNAVIILQMDLNWQLFFIGIVILIAVYIDHLRRQRGQIRARSAGTRSEVAPRRART